MRVETATLTPARRRTTPSATSLLAAQQEEIRAADAQLPDRQREVLALRELEGMSYDEIAEITGMDRNSVAQLISREAMAEAGVSYRAWAPLAATAALWHPGHSAGSYAARDMASAGRWSSAC